MNLRNEIEKLYGEYRELSLERQRKLEAVAIAIDDYNAPGNYRTCSYHA
jgi:hypothetical protein